MQMKISGASISRHPPRTMIEPQSPRNCNLASFDSFVTSSGMDMRFPVLFSPWSSPYHLHHRPHDHHLDQHDNDQHPERRLQVKWPIARQVNSTFPARILHAQPSPPRLHCHWNCHWHPSGIRLGDLFLLIDGTSSLGGPWFGHDHSDHMSPSCESQGLTHCHQNFCRRILHRICLADLFQTCCPSINTYSVVSVVDV